MSNFHALSETLATIVAANPAGMAVKALTIGEGAMAGALQCGEHVLAMRRQPDHEELLVILEGEATFRAGDEVRDIRSGDFIFISTQHCAWDRRNQASLAVAPFRHDPADRFRAGRRLGRKGTRLRDGWLTPTTN